MLRFVAAAMFAIAVSSGSVPAADPTHEKCTCDLSRESALNNGASVRNATACWSTEDPDRQWCDITVQAIEGDNRHQTIINELVQLQNDPESMTAFLQRQAEESILSSAVPPNIEILNQARADLPALMKTFDMRTSACVQGFIRYQERKELFTGVDEVGFSCQVGNVTGWLRMSFRVGNVSFVFMVAPNA
ncbi:hypothetical protein [Rhizobium sp. LC145]|uniref:hypothetical protein n=1 Tax=Rhizobium sp. LC145 TaxID=1120688 RepID=UPI00062A17BE|nr:hypothetical protein [Rhizobium sp. LC145]KKX29341.1 hypothetical protein YH62_16305 [Rhizobium sp. LC145]MDX3927862.1 hypothetical protein [Shinella sp.]TKT68951.1 hypothetical protein FDR95_00835 [Rhizobiaceae bacterium LC148]